MTLRGYLTRLIALSVLPLLLLAGWLTMSQLEHLRTDDDARAQQLARHGANVVDQLLGARIGALRMLSLSSAAGESGRRLELHQEAGAFQQAFGSPVLLVDDQARVLWHSATPATGTPPPLGRPSGRQAVALALASGRPEVGDLFRSPTDGVDQVAVATPLQPPQAARLVLLSAIAVTDVEALLQALELPDGWSLLLRDSQGRAIARVGPDPGPAVGRQSRAALRLAAWDVLLQTPAADDHADTARATAALALALLGATAASVAGGLWAGRRIARAVHSLATPEVVEPASAAIAEVSAVRHLLHQTHLARDNAVRQRLDDERSFRTTLERASIELQVKEAQLRGILESASDAILTTDATQAVVMANHAAARMFGCAVEDLVGHSIHELLPQRFRQHHQQAMAEFGRTPYRSRHMGDRSELTAVRRDGQEFPIEASISHIQVDGHSLFTVILRDVTERREAERLLRQSQAELETSHKDLRRLVAAQDRVQEDERKRIARELHDDLQQTLAAILMEVVAARAAVAPGAPVLDALSRIDRLSAEALQSTRHIVNDLRPQMLEDLGLVPALEALTRAFSERSGVACRFEAPGFDGDDDVRLRLVATCLYRAVQEALTNIGKHAQASRATVRLTRADADRVRLVVSDDGRGLQPQDRRKASSFGLLGMNERVQACGGTVAVQGTPDAGTRVVVEVPLPSAPADDGAD